MPTRRLVVALTMLLVGVFGVGIVTALGRIGDDGTPSAQPSPSFSSFTTPPFTEPPTDTPTESPTPEPTATRTPDSTTEPTAQPSGEPTTGPTVAPTGTSSPGTGPSMPKTGAPLALVVAATLLAGSALGVRRLAQ